MHRHAARTPDTTRNDGNVADGNEDASDLRREHTVHDKTHRKRLSVLLRLWLRLRLRLDNRRRCSVVILFVVGTLSTLILLRQLHAFYREYQGPLDHLSTSILEPYYGMFCPDFSSNGVGPDIQSTTAGDFIGIPSYCDTTASIAGNSTNNFPRIFMIGARDEDEDTFHTWKQMLQMNQDDSYSGHSPHLQRINTLEMSNQYALSGGARQYSTTNGRGIQSKSDKHGYLCRKMKWEHRLFAVYQSVFSNLLTTYPNDNGFVIVEDDAILKNPYTFVQEVCYAHNHQLGFYSLYHSPLQQQWHVLGRILSPSCIYQHGTVAFYIQRAVMEKIVNERRRGLFCRFPIDMYISRMGPWYATRREIVGHLDLGRVGST